MSLFRVAPETTLHIILTEYPHSKNGRQSKMVHHECHASQTIYIPVDDSLRMACIVPNCKQPHNHPILPSIKVSRELKDQYVKAIQVAGIAGNTVRTIDNGSYDIYFSSSFKFSCIDLTFLAPSTTAIFGMSPSLAAPALQSRRVREQILRKEKKRTYPCGLGIEGTLCFKCF